MAEKPTDTNSDGTEQPIERDARLAALRGALEKELVALLSHPLVPQEFKEVFEKK